MARLYEYQAKTLLEEQNISIPQGKIATSPSEIYTIADKLACPVAVKAQMWTTGRAALGAIQFAGTPGEARELGEGLLGMKAGNYRVDKVLVEEKLEIADEYYAGVIIDDAAKKPVLIFSSMGGTGIEEIAEKHPDKVARLTVDVEGGVSGYQARNLVRRTGIHGKEQMKLGSLVSKLVRIALQYEVRSAEINPIIITTGGDLYAADCRITIDDYAVFRHPELDIPVAREFGRPPTELDLIAYNVEKGDYRGTFYFIQMAQDFQKGEKVIGFHGAGGGGSMMSMDAVTGLGYTPANFCDTSGNPPASKVYRAAKIILAQKNIDGYFGSGSGVASQEQYHSARGLVKAFREEGLDIPAVIRLGGNSEDKAVKILEEYTGDLPAPVEGYKKDDTVEFCAERFDALVNSHIPGERETDFSPPVARRPYMFETPTGTVRFDHDRCLKCESKVCIDTCVPGILRLEDQVPVLNVTKEDAKNGKCIENFMG